MKKRKQKTKTRKPRMLELNSRLSAHVKPGGFTDIYLDGERYAANVSPAEVLAVHKAAQATAAVPRIAGGEVRYGHGWVGVGCQSFAHSNLATLAAQVEAKRAPDVETKRAPDRKRK